MPRTIEAIYENGVFKPFEKINIQEHKKVKIILPSENEEPSMKGSALDGICDIAEDCSDSDLSTNHDKYLYGELRE